ncbi:MAG: hypothetical protein QXH07_02390 [Thermoplasmata archaeon]
MDFKDAEIFLNVSLLYSGPPVLIVGKNGIGKTAMINEMVSKFKKAVFIPERIDFGGLKQAESQIVNLRIKTIAISDMQNILSRKSGIRNSTMGLLSSWMSEGAGGHELGFGNIQLTNKVNKKAENPINIVAAATPNHLGDMISYGYIDFLDRCVILFVSRSNENFFEKEFKLEHNPILKPDMEKYKNIMKLKLTVDSQRHSVYVKKIVAGIASIGINPIEYLQRNLDSINFISSEHVQNKDISAWLTRFSDDDIKKIKSLIDGV